MLDVEILSPMEEEEAYPPVAQLVELGRRKGYVTIEDVLTFFPDAEEDVSRLEEITNSSQIVQALTGGNIANRLAGSTKE